MQIRCFGQPVPQTHPHLVKTGEVTPGITLEEYKARRVLFMHSIANAFEKNQQRDHIVIIPSAPKTYMTHDIPYPFRQNTDFLYLCGFQEPDSVLVLEAKSGKLPDCHSTLFVPKKDPQRELWDGPRSGVDGALELTGVDAAENIDDLEHYLQMYSQSTRGFVLWYNYSKPVHGQFHAKHFMEFMKLNKNGFTENPRRIVQSLRLFKSPSEIRLMQKTCDIASTAFEEVMKFSEPGVSVIQCVTSKYFC